MDSGHRVVAVAAPGVATQNAPHGEPRAFEGAVFAQRLDGVLRTGGGVATRRGGVGRDEAAIEADGRNEQQRQPVEQGVHGTEGREKKRRERGSLRGGRRLGQLQTIGCAVEEAQQAFVHGFALHGLVGEPDEGEMHFTIGRDVLQEVVFLQTIGFAQLPFCPIAIDGMLEVAFRDGEQHFGVRTAPAVGQHAHEHAHGVGDHGFLSGGEQALDVALQTEVFGLGKGVTMGGGGRRHGKRMQRGRQTKTSHRRASRAAAGQALSERRWLGWSREAPRSGVGFANVVFEAFGDRTTHFEVDTQTGFFNGFGGGIAETAEADVALLEVGEIVHQTVHTRGGEDQDHVITFIGIGLELRFDGAEHGALGVFELLGVELGSRFQGHALRKGDEVVLRLVLGHGGDQLGPAAAAAEEHLALAILNELLDVENHFLGNAEILHVFGQGHTQFLTKAEEVFDGVARIENDGRIVENIDLLRAKFFGFESFDLDKGTERELYAEVLCNIVIRRFL